MGELTVIIGCLTALAVAQRDAGVAAQTSRLAVPGGEIAYDMAGSGPTVVFLHGAFMDRRSWDRQVAPFAKQFRVVRYDIRPFGESSQPEKAYSVPDDLLRLLDHLKVDRAHLVGHSFGGAAALDFALLYPDRVSSLVLVASPPNGFMAPPDEAKAATAVFAAVKSGDEAIVKAWLDHPMWSVARTRPELLKELEASTRRNLKPFRMSFAPYVPVKPAAVDRLAEIRVPLLVVVGDRDMASIRQAAEMVVKQVKSATLKIVAGADHALPLGWADEFNSAAIGFISAARR